MGGFVPLTLPALACLAVAPQGGTCEQAVESYRQMVARAGVCTRDDQCRAFGSAFLSAAGPVTPPELGCRILLNRDQPWEPVREAERQVLERCRYISMECGGAPVGRCADGRCVPARASTDPGADCKTSDVVAGRVARAALDLAGKSHAIRELADCDGKAMTALSVDYDDGRCRGRVEKLEGGTSSLPLSLSLSIQLRSREPWPRYHVVLGSPRCPRTLSVQVDHQMGRFVPSWLEDDANRPPEQWQCRTDADCSTGQICELTWREWSRSRKAWRGMAGRCERGQRCDGSGQCPEGLSCDGTRVYSSATAVMVPPRCRAAVLPRVQPPTRGN